MSHLLECGLDIFWNTPYAGGVKDLTPEALKTVARG